MNAVHMSEFKSKPGSFLPYLEYSQRGSSAADVAGPVSPVALLEILARQVAQALPIDDLMKVSQMEPERYRTALKSLREEGYIEVDGPALEEIVRITDAGAKVAKLTRPA